MQPAFNTSQPTGFYLPYPPGQGITPGPVPNAPLNSVPLRTLDNNSSVAGNADQWQQTTSLPNGSPNDLSSVQYGLQPNEYADSFATTSAGAATLSGSNSNNRYAPYYATGGNSPPPNPSGNTNMTPGMSYMPYPIVIPIVVQSPSPASAPPAATSAAAATAVSTSATSSVGATASTEKPAKPATAAVNATTEAVTETVPPPADDEVTSLPTESPPVKTSTKDTAQKVTKSTITATEDATSSPDDKAVAAVSDSLESLTRSLKSLDDPAYKDAKYDESKKVANDLGDAVTTFVFNVVKDDPERLETFKKWLEELSADNFIENPGPKLYKLRSRYRRFPKLLRWPFEKLFVKPLLKFAPLPGPAKSLVTQFFDEFLFKKPSWE
jgi:hypothetical protein